MSIQALTSDLSSCRSALMSVPVANCRHCLAAWKWETETTARPSNTCAFILQWMMRQNSIQYKTKHDPFLENRYEMSRGDVAHSLTVMDNCSFKPVGRSLPLLPAFIWDTVFVHVHSNHKCLQIIHGSHQSISLHRLSEEGKNEANLCLRQRRNNRQLSRQLGCLTVPKWPAGEQMQLLHFKSKVLPATRSDGKNTFLKAVLTQRDTQRQTLSS